MHSHVISGFSITKHRINPVTRLLYYLNNSWLFHMIKSCFAFKLNKWNFFLADESLVSLITLSESNATYEVSKIHSALYMKQYKHIWCPHKFTAQGHDSTKYLATCLKLSICTGLREVNNTKICAQVFCWIRAWKTGLSSQTFQALENIWDSQCVVWFRPIGLFVI